MKKNILGGIAVLVIAAIAAWNVSMNSQNSGLSDIQLANVEALADGESGGGAHLTCYCALMSDQNCAVNNNGSSVCAGGENVRCWEYNRNCN